MSERIYLRYDGPLLKGHKIDAAILGPALVSFDDLFKETNQLINGDKARIEVLVNADIQPNCVTLVIEIALHAMQLWDGVKSFLNNPDIQAAKTLLEWLVLPGGLLAYLHLKDLKGKPNASLQVVESENKTKISLIENGQVKETHEFPKQVIYLSKKTEILKAAKGILAPVANIKGIDIVEFEQPNIQKKLSINKEGALAISAAIKAEAQPLTNNSEGKIIGHISVHSPVFSERAKKWDFLYGGHVEKIDISETDIAPFVVNRGKAVIGDTWKVEMEVTEKQTSQGEYKNEYKVTRILDFMPGPEQRDLPLGQSELDIRDLAKIHRLLKEENTVKRIDKKPKAKVEV